jgi:bacillithiol biosynthesis deacetylase BshB1
MATLLVVGPHPDDQELGMGGTIALLASQGHRVVLLDLTDGEPTPYGDPATRAREAAAAAAELGRASAAGGSVERRLLGLKNREVVHSVENRHRVAGVIRAVQAWAVFTPYFEDAHPDHVAGTRLVEDARFDAKLTGVRMPGDEGGPPIYPRWLFYYYATHLRHVAQPSFIVDVSATLEVKARALRCYRSQFEANPANRGLVERVCGWAEYFGSRIGTNAGEGFFTREPIGLAGLGALIGA